jgi:type II secretory pathway component HofQ
MNRLLFLFALLLCQESTFAAVYITAAEPTMPSAPAGAAASSGMRKCVGKELRINFTNMSVKATLQVLADFSGNKLVVDHSVSGSGAFSYECVPWDTVLQDIASRQNLIVKVENGTISAMRR